MRIIISPAKKMVADIDTLEPTALPLFLSEASTLLAALREMDTPSLKALWRCNDLITQLNVSRLLAMDLEQGLTPAILSYEGIQYRYMAPSVFETRQLAYVDTHLRILSGFYGLLRPFDGVTPYRLEMQAKLTVGGYKDLYAFWGEKPAVQLAEETDVILNLASKEYSRAVAAHLPKHVRFVACVFGELKDGKVIEKGTMCKMARGEMIRFLAERNITDIERVKAFNHLGYTYCAERSAPDTLVFIK